MVNTEIRLIIFFAAKDGEALYSQHKQDWELTVAQIMNFLITKFRFNLKKVGKTTRPFRYDLNQISYDYKVEVTSSFKGLDLIEFCQENALVIANTNNTREDSTNGHHRNRHTNGQYQNQIDYILCSQRWRSSIESA